MTYSTVGVIFSNIHDENIPELSRFRTMGSIPFGGRYRLIDFALSNMVNSGITTVGIVTKNRYRSLLEHLSSGKDWDLARKDGGIILLPPYSTEGEKLYFSRLEALYGIKSFLEGRREEFVVLCDCDGVLKLDFSELVREHEQSRADLTLLYRPENGPAGKDSIFLEFGGEEPRRVKAVKFDVASLQSGAAQNRYLNIMAARRERLLAIVDEAAQYNCSSFSKDILGKKTDSLRIFGRPFEGYYAGIHSLESYFRRSMDFLKKSVRHEFFSAGDVFTRVRDFPPTRYASGAVVKNSLVADGCTVEGTVEGCILFRGVKVGKGSVLRNSILMQDTQVGCGVWCECVITDKSVVIRDGRHLAGCETLPYFVEKGKML